MKERKKCKKKLAITDLNTPNGSRDIPFQSREFEQDGRRHFVDFTSLHPFNLFLCAVLLGIKLSYYLTRSSC